MPNLCSVDCREAQLASTSVVMSEEKKPFQRLPTDVVPVNYKLELRPDLKAFTFQGKLDITAKVWSSLTAGSCTNCYNFLAVALDRVCVVCGHILPLTFALILILVCRWCRLLRRWCSTLQRLRFPQLNWQEARVSLIQLCCHIILIDMAMDHTGT